METWEASRGEKPGNCSPVAWLQTVSLIVAASPLELAPNPFQTDPPSLIRSLRGDVSEHGR